ncbi:MAG: alpha-amylase family glycosyl hydrolase, partial [Candidatus Kariarchaeaceae archaeon]
MVNNIGDGKEGETEPISMFSEFLISGQIREKFGLQDVTLLTDTSIHEQINNVQQLTESINSELQHEAEPVYLNASDINGIIILEKLSHQLINTFRSIYDPDLLTHVSNFMEEQVGKENYNLLLSEFVEEYAPQEIRANRTNVESLLKSNRDNVVQNMLVKMFTEPYSTETNISSHQEEDRGLNSRRYREFAPILTKYIKEKTILISQELSLIDLIQLPLSKEKQLEDQLRYICDNWEPLLGSLRSQLLASVDFIQEETKVRIQGHGPSEIYDYNEFEYENFTPDKDWMPNLILIAKNTYVWLYQLSIQYKKEIRTLDQIPEEELQLISNRGFTGLWLIGVWERSKASKMMKHWYGNPEAKGSAYSIFDYQIADELGGIDALENLSNRARKYNIRLGSDMVPNHTSIDSKWIIDHPDWFISTKYCPFPSYSFSGESLLDNPNIGVFVEDHYFDGSDAAVVFQRKDLQTGETLFIYHGNDGTSMPWNDTAQLNYLHSHVRE